MEIINLKKDYLLKKKLPNSVKKVIIKKFEESGILKFPNFSSSNKSVINFIDQFTYQYANDASRRETRFENKKIRNVDSGKQEIFLHSETSFSPSQPEIVWFYCVNPGKRNSGQTVYCDGLELWQKLPAHYKFFFLENPIRFKLKIPITKKLKGRHKKKWFLEYPGVSNCYLNYASNCLEFEFSKFAVEKARITNKFSFANHLIIPLISEPQILSRKVGKDKLLSLREHNQIKKIAYSLTHDICWKKNDLVMIDNYRFMHGRRKIDINDNIRDIVTMQTLKANFGYGNNF